MLQLPVMKNNYKPPTGRGENQMSRAELYTAMSIGERLRITRLAMKLTQKSMAHPLSVTREAYTMYETGARIPPWDMAIELTEAWGLTLDWIYKGDLSGLPAHLVEKINRSLPRAKTRIT